MVLLAAGRATRFGAPKLVAPLNDRPLIEHIAQTVSVMPFAYRLCVVTQGGPQLDRFKFAMIEVERGAPLSRSLATGIDALMGRDIDGAMVLLADMPRVSGQHLMAMVNAFDGDIVGSSSGGIAMPPAIFGRKHFARLRTLSGDMGARALLKGAVLVQAPAVELIDIDTPADLVAAQTLGGGGPD